MTTVHVPILVKPIVEALLEPFLALPDDAPAHAIVDCTLGGGGHTAALLAALAADPKTRKHQVISLDQDEGAVARARERFAKEIGDGKLLIFHSRFGEVDKVIQANSASGASSSFTPNSASAPVLGPVLGMMADLGFSSDQLEDSDRGLSFMREGPLDMRLDTSRGQSARAFLQKVTERELESILSELGEERFSRRIASAIIQARRDRQLPDTTTGLADLISRAMPPAARHGRIHAATRTFQALRIHVNEELKELDQLLARAIILMKPGGRLAILSFHSLEDRRVKLAFRGDDFRALTKKPIEPSEDEIRANPRARSAKLRVGERQQ
jgi:16S rRNA (cytosine1402-N4)-methyltransferase